MEKELPESKQEELIKENESPESSENRQEIAEKSDSFPPQKITNPPETNGAESETPPSEERGENNEEPSAPWKAAWRSWSSSWSRPRPSGARVKNNFLQPRRRWRKLCRATVRCCWTSTPEAPESMVIGETVDEVDRSFAEAKALVQRVRRDVEEKLAKERLPAGSPTRGPANFSSLSSMEKIRAALSDQ